MKRINPEVFEENPEKAKAQESAALLQKTVNLSLSLYLD